MADAVVKGQQDYNTNASAYNAAAFQIEQAINKINTAEPVRVTGVNPGGVGKAGTVTVQPIVNQVTGTGEGMEQSAQYNLPYLRIQGGENAVIIDPQVGDIGLAVYAQRDTTTMKEGDGTACNPGSARCYSKGDGFYLGGFLNKTPVRYVHVEDEGITVDDGAGGKIELKSGQCTITAPAGILLDTPVVTVAGVLATTGANGGSGSVTVNGSITSTGDQVASGISQTGHVHGGVEPGSGTTGGPQ